jgi:hypothetical protein
VRMLCGCVVGRWRESSGGKKARWKVVHVYMIAYTCQDATLQRLLNAMFQRKRSRRNDREVMPMDVILLRHTSSFLEWRSVVRDRPGRAGSRIGREDDEMCAVADPNAEVFRCNIVEGWSHNSNGRCCYKGTAWRIPCTQECEAIESCACFFYLDKDGTRRFRSGRRWSV